jgi:glutamate carboxypeptidase
MAPAHGEERGVANGRRRRKDRCAELGFVCRTAATAAPPTATRLRRGCPTLDGLGPIGGDDHSADEWLDVESIVPRIAMLAGIIARL